MKFFNRGEKKSSSDRDKAKACYNFFMLCIIVIGLCFIFNQMMFALAFTVLAVFLSSCSSEFEIRYLREKVDRNG